MADAISFLLDGKLVAAEPAKRWDVAKREGIRIPHLCHVDLPGYRPDGNCRICMVEIEGERVLAASCIRRPIKAMSVRTDTERADKARRMVVELLASNMRPAEEGPDNQSTFWNWRSRWEYVATPLSIKICRDASRIRSVEPGVAVNLDACIACGACVRLP
jgi:formate dehydrogenase major subunit